MNEQFTNDMQEMDVLLKETARNTNPNPQFMAELEQSLADTHREKSKPGWFQFTHKQIFATFAWTVSLIVFALVMSWAIRTVAPVPTEVPAANDTTAPAMTATPAQSQATNNTPDPDKSHYDFRGASLIMDTGLPETVAESHIYQLLPAEPANAEYARELAARFGVDGEVYTTHGIYPDTLAYEVTDGNRQIIVYGENNFSYTSNLVKNSRQYEGYQFNTAEATIHTYLQDHGFDTGFTPTQSDIFTGYIWQQLAPDGLPINYESYSQPVLRITLDENSEVLSLNAALIKFDSNPLGTYGILSPDEALQSLLDESQYGGKIESGHGGPHGDFVPPQNWYHDYPDNETVTISGNVQTHKAVAAGKPNAVFVNNILMIGNNTGMDALQEYAYVQATGQFVSDDGVRKFNVETWTEVQQVSVAGYAYREGDLIVVSNEYENSKKYTLIDPPADLPLDTKFPESYLTVDGSAIGDQLLWTSIQFIADASQMGGGGGGGGMGFYQLNLSGTPVPFPTKVAQGKRYTPAELASFAHYTVEDGDTLAALAEKFNVNPADIMSANYMADETLYTGWQITIPGLPGPTRVDNVSGALTVQIYQKPDGRERTVYNFLPQGEAQYYELLGDNLEALQALNNRPIHIWGAITHDNTGRSFITVERFKEQYPGLEFQVLNGTQTYKDLNGQQVTLLTADGVTYVQMDRTGAYPDQNYYDGAQGVYVEGLLVSDETYEGYPTIRVINASPVTNPATGDPLTFTSIAGTIEKMPDPFGNADVYITPDIVIDSVQLEYYTTSAINQPGSDPGVTEYLQPVWHFHGHNTNGDVLDFLIQALRQEYLSPEFSTYTTPG